MDLQKLILYVNIFGICLPVAITYFVIANIIAGQPIYPSTIVCLGFGYVVMIKRNVIFHELWNKWCRKKL